jgi:hypothetical protein
MTDIDILSRGRQAGQDTDTPLRGVRCPAVPTVMFFADRMATTNLKTLWQAIQPYQAAFDALERRCPDFVPNDRWRQAVDDGRQFLALWGELARAHSWTVNEIFGLPDLPDQPRADHGRLRRVDALGVCWLLRTRRVIELTSTEAVILCPSSATLKYRRTATATPTADIDKVAPAKEIDGAVPLYRPAEAALVETINSMAQIGKPTPVGFIDAARHGLGDAPKPAHRRADAANHAEATHLIPEDLSIPEFLRRPAAQVVKAAPIGKPTPVRIIDAPAGSPQEPIRADGTSEAPKAALERSTDGNVLTTAVAP